ncbi:hypothetical protein ES705_41684 [subsurface metagenome]
MLSKRIFVLVSLLLVSFLLVGCGTTPLIVDNHAPVITSEAVTEATVGVAYTYNVEANDPDFDALTYFLIRNPSGMTIGKYTGVITWTPVTAGSFGVTVKVSDGVKSDTQSFTITIEPVAKFIGITVDPETMALEVGENGTFQVTANYSFGEPQVVTTDCVYTLPTPTTGVITVEAGSVTTAGVGTDTIFISYTEGGGVTVTATIAVTVSRVRIPMEITVDLPPTFTVGEPYWFTVTMTANDDLGKSVKASFGWPISALGVKISGTLETDVGSDVTFALADDVFQSEFTMEDTTTVYFRGTFDRAGAYLTTIEVRTSSGDVLLCEKVITIVVEGDPLAVGDSYGGGIVTYIFVDEDEGYDPDIQHGLIAATEDQSEGIIWATPVYINSDVGTLPTIGSGSANTDAIIAQHIEVDVDTYAAGLARAYTGGGYDDWFLPSKDELNQLWLNRELIGGFAVGEYWSSSEASASHVWQQRFVGGWSQTNYHKNATRQVRPVRYF